MGRRALPEWTLEGEIKEATVPRLLNAYYEARHHGELKLKQGQVLKVVYFEAGQPVYAASNLAQERFARFCARRGVLSESDLQAVAALSKEEGLRTGDAMTRLGLHRRGASAAQLVEEQVKEIIWSTFAWSTGGYGFSPMRLQRAGLVKLSIFPGDLILEGVLKQETLVALRQKMPRARRLFPTADPPYALHELKLAGPPGDAAGVRGRLARRWRICSRSRISPSARRSPRCAGLELMGILEERREESQPPPHHLRALSGPAVSAAPAAQHRGQPRQSQRRQPPSHRPSSHIPRPGGPPAGCEMGDAPHGGLALEAPRAEQPRAHHVGEPPRCRPPARARFTVSIGPRPARPPRARR